MVLHGRFLHKLGIKGKGLNEYSHIRAIATDKVKSEILILDDVKSEIFHYNLQGKLLFKEKAGIYPSKFASRNGKLFYFQDKSSYYFGDKIKYDLLITENGKILHKDFPFKKDLGLRMPLNRVFYEINDTVCFVDRWNSNIYSISNDKVLLRFHIDFDGNEIPHDCTKNYGKFASKGKNYSYLFNYVLENESYIYFNYLSKGKLNKRIYNKTQKFCYSFSDKEDASELISLTFSPIYTYNNYFVSIVQPHLLKDKRSTYLLNNDTIRKIASNIELTDNLVLTFCKFKNKINNKIGYNDEIK